MRITRRILLAVALTLFVVGCSDDSSREREFASGVLDAKQQFDSAYSDIRGSNDQPTPATEADRQALAAATGEALKTVRALEPPDEYRDVHKRLIAAFKQVDLGARQLADASALESKAGAVQAKQGTSELIQGTIAIEVEIEALQSAS
jgi:hypothetical protein